METPRGRAESDTAGRSAPPEEPVNPRKRKKTSRACDFCHLNHQPCDNAEPRCSVCEKHNKPCLYLRPQKKRGPAKGYRSTLNSLNESAAAWGAALNLVPSLGPVIEGYLKSPEGQRLVQAVKDPKQQDFFIRSWQESGVFRAFFGSEETPDPANDDSVEPSSFPPAGDGERPNFPPSLDKTASTSATSSAPTSVHSHSFREVGQFKAGNSRPAISDIVARDAARSARQRQSAFQTLGPLGFAPNETFADFHAMTSHPEPLPNPRAEEHAFELGSEMDQRAYYNLVMGRQFHQQFG